MRQNRISINDIKYDLIKIIDPWDGILENKPESEKIVFKLFNSYLRDLQKQNKITEFNIVSSIRDTAITYDVAIKISELVDFERIVFDDKSSIFVTTNGQDELKMVFKDECWTEVDEDALGRIYNDLNVAGDELTIRGQSPFRVLLGKARSVDIIYNGNVVDLEPYIAQDQTAKLRFTD